MGGPRNGPDGPIDRVVTVSEVWQFLGLVYAAGVVVLLVNGDWCVLGAAVLVTLLLGLANADGPTNKK